MINKFSTQNNQSLWHRTLAYKSPVSKQSQFAHPRQKNTVISLGIQRKQWFDCFDELHERVFSLNDWITPNNEARTVLLCLIYTFRKQMGKVKVSDKRHSKTKPTGIVRLLLNMSRSHVITPPTKSTNENCKQQRIQWNVFFSLYITISLIETKRQYLPSWNSVQSFCFWLLNYDEMLSSTVICIFICCNLQWLFL